MGHLFVALGVHRLNLRDGGALSFGNLAELFLRAAQGQAAMVTLYGRISVETTAVCFSHRICFLHLLSLFSLSLNHRLKMNLGCVRYFSICYVDDVVIVSLLRAVGVCRDFELPLLSLLNAVQICFDSLVAAGQVYVVAFEIFDVQLLANLELS